MKKLLKRSFYFIGFLVIGANCVYILPDTLRDYVYYPWYVENADEQIAFMEKIRAIGEGNQVPVTELHSKPWDYVCRVFGSEYSTREIRSELAVTDLAERDVYETLKIHPGDFGFKKFNGLVFYSIKEKYVKAYIFPRDYIRMSGRIHYERKAPHEYRALMNRKNACRTREDAIIQYTEAGNETLADGNPFPKITLFPTVTEEN